MLLVQAIQRHAAGTGKRGMQQIGLLRAGEQHVAQPAHGFLRHHGPDGAHMLHIHLGESIRCGLQSRTVLVGDDRGGTHDVFEHRGPPSQLQFAGHGIVVDAAIA